MWWGWKISCFDEKKEEENSHWGKKLLCGVFPSCDEKFSFSFAWFSFECGGKEETLKMGELKLRSLEILR